MKINLLLVRIWTFPVHTHTHTPTLHQWNIYNVFRMEISSVYFLSISGIILSLWVFKIMTLLEFLNCLFFSKLLYVQTFLLPLSKHCHCKESLSLVSHHSLWGQQPAMSEAALWKWPCDKELRPPAKANKELRSASNLWAWQQIRQPQLRLEMTAVPTDLTATSWENPS